MRELEQRSGIGRETIRYYIGLGLLPEPDRPRPNVAIYDERHVARLSTIKRLQSERYLPLSFIKTLLDRPSHGELRAIPGVAELLAPRLGLSVEAPTTPLAAAAAAGLTLAELETLARDKALFIVTDSLGGAALAAADLNVALAWGRAKAAGYSPEAGFFADDLRLYAETLIGLTDREIERFFTRVPGGRSTEEAAALAQAGIELINDLIVAMRTNYLLRRVGELGAESLSGGPSGDSD
jgi:DNA-binding transcriptional MerR regulator